MKNPIVLTGRVTSNRVLDSRFRSALLRREHLRQNSAERLGCRARMMPVSESPETQTGTTEGSNTLAVDKSCISGLPCAIVKLPETALNGTVIPTNRHRFPLHSLAAPAYGDFIPQVGRAYRMSANKGLNFAVDHLLDTSPEGDALVGLNPFRKGSRTRPFNVGPGSSKDSTNRNKGGEPYNPLRRSFVYE